MFCFAVLLLLFVSAFVFAFPCFAVHVLLAVRCRLVLRIVMYCAYSLLLRSCSVFSLPARRRPTSLRLVDGFVGQGVGSLVVLSVDMSYFPMDFIFSESVP